MHGREKSRGREKAREGEREGQCGVIIPSSIGSAAASISSSDRWQEQRQAAAYLPKEEDRGGLGGIQN
jgi:hypothetical protein